MKRVALSGVLGVLLAWFLLGASPVIAVNSGSPVQQQQKTYSRYCIVVGSFHSEKLARQYGKLYSAKGYDVFFQEGGNGFFRVCLNFNLTSEGAAYKKLADLRANESLIIQCWANELTGSAEPMKENIASVQKTEPKPTPPPVTRKETVAPAKTPIAEKAKSAEPKIEEKVNKPVVQQATPKSEPKQEPVVAKQEPKKEEVRKTEPAPVLSEKKTEEKKEKVVEADKKTYSRYCLIVKDFQAAESAKEYGDSLMSKGYNVFVRKVENNKFGICMYNMSSEGDAEKRLDKMQHIDRIFLRARIFGYDDIADNFSIDSL